MESIHIEQNLIKETVGSQDQVNVVYGWFNRMPLFLDWEFTKKS